MTTTAWIAGSVRARALVRRRIGVARASDRGLRRRPSAAVHRHGIAALAGWCPADAVPPLAARLEPAGGALVTLPSPPGVSPPTMLRSGTAVRRSFDPLVRAYGTVPYATSTRRCSPGSPTS